ncbi:MAG: CsbD family protein [Chloroflexi bacterium]|nr:MAG: CsbD family protein [Chloroflexota bacterium]
MADTKVKGTIDRAKGKTRETAGKVTGKRSTQAKGKAEQLKGRAKEKFG